MCRPWPRYEPVQIIELDKKGGRSCGRRNKSSKKDREDPAAATVTNPSVMAGGRRQESQDDSATSIEEEAVGDITYGIYADAQSIDYMSPDGATKIFVNDPQTSKWRRLLV